ncbi:chaperone SurA [Iodidimonas nitroreducens]|uniref:Parvulin-like PPIase n=2 Tax=Iodidimonas nitroreducens TaxID=1236968 RepID=A0A5A7N427_9PROT|nr:chaperone SurA [alpha proteobacterium Q-1]GER02888.1 chaperone SurA [Iodidimonas nitroreducens]
MGLSFGQVDAQAQSQNQQQGQSSAPESNLVIPQRIVALVNDEPISAYDVVQRLRLTIASIGGIEDEEQLARLQEQVVRNMVDDKLKLQEAAEFELFITDDDAQSAFVRQAQSFNQSPQQFEDYLTRLGITKQAYLEQMKAEIAWGELVNGRLGRMANVAQEEVEQEIARIESNAGQPQYNVSEIYLLIDNPSREDDVRQTAMRISEQIRNGANFAGFAQQFSQSSTAASGGDMGWVTPDQLNPALANALTSIPVGDISEPIRHAGGYYILQLKDRRRVLEADPLDMQLDIRQIFLPITPQSTEAEQIAFFDRFDGMKSTMTSCDSIGDYAQELGIEPSPPLGRLRLRDLPGGLRTVLEDLEMGVPSQPVRMEDGFRIFFVCDRSKPEVPLPQFDEIIDQLERQKLAIMARRYLRDLRRNAIVDYR